MTTDAWPSFSFTELLKPPDGWKTDCAVLTTYSADLVVVVTALLALTGCDLDERPGSRAELVKAIEALRGRVRIIAQAGRVAIPNPPRPILKLLDRFLISVEADENICSWHPKIAFIRYNKIDDPTDRQWRVWLGSRNLTRALNCEAGLVLASRSDGKGQHIDGLAALGKTLADRARLPSMPANPIRAELAKTTWDGPPGTRVHRVTLFGPGLTKGFPQPPADTARMFIVSPFLDAQTIRAASTWGGPTAHRALVSTAIELQRLFQQDDTIFTPFSDVFIHALPDLPAECAVTREEEDHTAVQVADGEEAPPAGLHAKLYYAAKGSRRQLWLGSPNATDRGWQGRNYEVVAELSLGREAADAIEAFVATRDRFKPTLTDVKPDDDEEALERARKLLSGHWQLRQRIHDDADEIIASAPPPLPDQTIELEIAALGSKWIPWPPMADRLLLPGTHRRHRTDFLQIRVMRGDRMCAWVQMAPCDLPPDDDRDHALIGEYLDPRAFLSWIRSVLADAPAHAGGGDWDAEAPPTTPSGYESTPSDISFVPTVEEILRSWARDPAAFVAANEKVKTYLKELERRAAESNATRDLALLQAFRRTWDTLAAELR